MNVEPEVVSFLIENEDRVDDVDFGYACGCVVSGSTLSEVCAFHAGMNAGVAMMKRGHGGQSEW